MKSSKQFVNLMMIYVIFSVGNILIVFGNSRIAFGNGSVTLRCDKYYLSIMNLTTRNESELVRILEDCDGKQQCTFPTSQDLKDSSVSFYCTSKQRFHLTYIAQINTKYVVTRHLSRVTCSLFVSIHLIFAQYDNVIYDL